jgi:hypothetical protein
VLDGVYLEKLGIPTSVICTQPFMDHGKATASTHGFVDYPLVEMFHPLATALPAALEKEAERVLDEVLGLLLIK